jgi:hypothetical protein
LVAPRAAHIPLPPLGVFGLDPTTAFKLPAISIPRPGGTASLQVRFPDDAALIGQDFFAQAFFVDDAGRGRLSATIRDTVR